ncbi:hypothetical protein FACS1894190_15650 [Spirochaetia bacterium]|nr:hypothetical protein FACS1894190_15650 [Spirochaetia bacterium]
MTVSKVSIIVPVYNVEKYFSRCMESIVTQTFNDFECILVDDKSTDVSPALCDEWAKKDTRIKVIHNSGNKGASISRKIGLDSANGSYILFIDSDDWIEPDMVEKLYTKAVDGSYDIVCCDFYIDDIGIRIYSNQDIYGMDKTIMIKNILNFSNEYPLLVNIWNKLFSRNIISKVQFPEKSWGEDRVINIEAVHYAQKIGHINKALYHYCLRSQSTSRSNGMTFYNYPDLYCNYKMSIKFLQEKYYDISVLDPELSNAINTTKFHLIRNNTTRNKNIMLDLYPESNKNIFHNNPLLSFKKKILLWLASKGIFFPNKLLNIIESMK